MTRTLVIVESPTKARTLEKFLGDDYVVESSIGHVRDLPANAAEIPKNLKGEAWARLGMPDAHMAFERRQGLGGEHVADQPQAFTAFDALAIGNGHAGGFLAAMLEAKQAPVN